MSVKPEAYPPSNPRGFGITSCSNCGQPVDLVDVPQAITGHTFTRDEIATAMTSPTSLACRASAMSRDEGFAMRSHPHAPSRAL